MTKIPRWFDCNAAKKALGWTPSFSKLSMFRELAKFSEQGPGRPEWTCNAIQKGFMNDDGVEIGMNKKYK